MALQVANQARTIGEEAEKLLKQSQQDTEQALAEISKEILTSANEIRQYLSYSEVQAMIAPYEKKSFVERGTGQSQSETSSTI